MSQFLSSHDIVIYNLTTKVFGLGVFIYGALLKALWPTLTEAIVQNNWSMSNSYARRSLAFGLSFMLINTILLIWLMPEAIKLIAPRETIVIPMMFILFMGAYQILRVWTDTFATILQSMSDIRTFWLTLPLQSFLSVILQWSLTPHFGIHEILLGLTGLFILTTVWFLPLAVIKHYKNAQKAII